MTNDLNKCIENCLFDKSDFSDTLFNDIRFMGDIPPSEESINFFNPIENSEKFDSAPKIIPTIIGNRPLDQNQFLPRQPTRFTVPRNKNIVKALSLPVIWSANHRSIWPRLQNTIDELIELDAHVGFHCEVWENKGNVNHQSQLERVYEVRGVSYISNSMKWLADFMKY